MKQPILGKWEIGDKENGFEYITGWKFIDFDGCIGIFDSKESALAASHSLECWEKHCSEELE